MGKIWSKAKKPIQNFNLERRLDKALDAPKTKKPSKRHIDPDSELYRKDDDLIKRVGKAGFFKTSVEPTTDGRPNPDAIPHLSRAQIVEPEFGFHDVPAESIPKGKTTLPKLLEILTEVAPPTLSGAPPNVAGSRTADDVVKPGRSDFTITEERAAEIAKSYNLEPEQVISLAKRFKLFDLHIPSTRTNSYVLF